MNGGSYVALSGIVAEHQKLEMITNNLANANTVGYKSSRPIFGEFLSNEALNVLSSGSEKPFVDKVYPISLSSYNNMTEGSIKKTGNSLDLAISGGGFFAVQTAGGVKYTRNGVFSLNNLGEIVNQTGIPILGVNKKPIVLNERGSDITISKSGIISLTDPATGDQTYAGKILTVNFKNPQYLAKFGNTMFSATKDSGQPTVNSNQDILQGYVEESNVNDIKDMADMINISQVNSYMTEVLKSYSQVDGTAINTIGAAV